MSEKIDYKQPIEVWTFTGWEAFDWEQFYSVEEAFEFLDGCKIRNASQELTD